MIWYDIYSIASLSSLPLYHLVKIESFAWVCFKWWAPSPYQNGVFEWKPRGSFDDPSGSWCLTEDCRIALGRRCRTITRPPQDQDIVPRRMGESTWSFVAGDGVEDDLDPWRLNESQFRKIWRRNQSSKRWPKIAKVFCSQGRGTASSDKVQCWTPTSVCGSLAVPLGLLHHMSHQVSLAA